jgi:anti-sigma B factor antagonist
MARQRITVEDVGDVSVVTFVDKRILDEQHIQLIRDDMFRLVDELGRRKLLLNFTNVEFLASAMLGKLMSLYKRLAEVGGTLVLCSISKDIKVVFKLMTFDKIMKIVDDEQTGLNSF